MPVAGNALLVAHRLCHRLAEDDTHILHRVVGVYLQIAGGLDLQIDQTMAGNLGQHVFKKRQSGA